jgi:hypothetical protein
MEPDASLRKTSLLVPVQRQTNTFHTLKPNCRTIHLILHYYSSIVAHVKQKYVCMWGKADDKIVC